MALQAFCEVAMLNRFRAQQQQQQQAVVVEVVLPRNLSLQSCEVRCMIVKFLPKSQKTKKKRRTGSVKMKWWYHMTFNNDLVQRNTRFLPQQFICRERLTFDSSIVI